MMVAAVALELYLLLRLLECDHMPARRLNDDCNCIEEWFVWVALLVMLVALLVQLVRLVFEIVVMQHRQMLQLCRASS